MTRSGSTLLKTMLLGIGLVATAVAPALAQKNSIGLAKLITAGAPVNAPCVGS